LQLAAALTISAFVVASVGAVADAILIFGFTAIGARVINICIFVTLLCSIGKHYSQFYRLCSPYRRP
jgi:hypothetical protein